MNRLICAAVTLLFCTAAVAEGPELNPRLVASAERSIENASVRGLSIGVIKDGSMTVRGFGEMSADNSATPDGDTVFEIGSITKVFTSLLAQIQVDAARIAWDDTLGHRFADIDFANADVAAITLRELAGHVSGLPRLPSNIEPEDLQDPYKGYSREHLLAYLVAFNPDQLDKSYAYSNLGAGILGVVAADAANVSLSTAYQEYVTGPLSLQDTVVNMRADQTDRLAQGYSNGVDMPNWSGFDALAGAGALLSSNNDLLRFISHNLDADVMSAALLAIRRPQREGQVAYGWHLADPDDAGLTYWHNGGTGGYASFMAFRPSDRTGVVILSTSTEYSAITEMGFMQMSNAAASAEIQDLSAYPGAYEIRKGFAVFVSEEDGRLFAQASGQAAFALSPDGEHEFVFEAANIRIVFDEFAAGQASKLVLDQDGQITPAKRVEKIADAPNLVEVDIDAATLQDYVGNYQLAPSMQLSVLARNDRLFVQLSGQPSFPVYAYDADKFFYKVVDAQLHFEREGDNVVAVVLHQNGQQRAPRVIDTP